MVDFRKKLGKIKSEREIHPCDIYKTLDRASDKGPLRPVQEQILNKWFDDYREEKDVILKLHTGQGKTLIGLLILQSKINQGTGPALYLCANNYLIKQTCEQAESFGIKYTTMNKTLPDSFIDGQAILITTVSKLFNGLTKFGLGAQSHLASSIVMDDSHACIDMIKDATRIILKNNTQAYADILDLFETEIEKQGVGTFADIKNKEYQAFLPVPYWDWYDKHSEVAKILSKHRNMNEIKFAWPIIKDSLNECQCIISGSRLEITPYVTPLNIFETYYKAEHRVFMSATIHDDSFFIKDLGLKPEIIKNPLCLENEKWSGEKMLLIPSLINDNLNRTEIVSMFAKPKENREYGVVALVPSFNSCKDWEKYGSIIASNDNIDEEINKLKNKNCKKTLVIVNRYDGIDLPDHTCRILLFDSKPYNESLEDRYLESCMRNSEVLTIKLAQTIEQGLGRPVRGEKDYSAILLIGSDLVKIIRSKKTKKYFSQQTRTQIDIGLKIAEYAKEEVSDDSSKEEAKHVLNSLIQQLLTRDQGWKSFYVENMNEVSNEQKTNNILTIFEAERKAFEEFRRGEYINAKNILQSLIDNNKLSEEEEGWYLQEMAKYIYPHSKSQSNELQVAAHRKNRYLLKPKEGMKISKMTTISLKRIENIISWIRSFENYEELKINIDSILTNLRFGVNSDSFEEAFDDLAKALGFISQRPDKEWKEGPDNLWKIKDNQYLLVECKSEVSSTRKEIHKSETGQMNNSCAWFSKNYDGVLVKNIMIIPTLKVNKAGGFNNEVEIIRKNGLKKLNDNVNNFFKEFKNLDFQDLTKDKIQELINIHKLSADDLLNEYSEAPKN